MSVEVRSRDRWRQTTNRKVRIRKHLSENGWGRRNETRQWKCELEKKTLPGISVKKPWYKEEREITILSKKTVDTRNEERRNRGRDENNVCVGLHVCLSLSPRVYASFLPFTDLGYLSVLFYLLVVVCVWERERERERIVVAVTLYTRIWEISVRVSYGTHDWGLLLFSLALSGKFQNSPVRLGPHPS
jgi:hypothetical protein